ncbi:class I SAM-dependent methyltransferase [Chromohalobacter japonicus]|uniref:class I SAM-dependent methyltransferase n=1 Tax=Chromohalobacter japonicus TaxID=223900 RepID=UPI001FF25B80|nr:class I SAM-dependent methyltransferase [Chromohalobacter japonicus]MCK0753258.1 hypothetical protein [Chromohalobacter japonicus]
MSDASMEMAARQAELTIKPSINTLAQGSMFWQPSYLERSVWLEHLPFLFWLVEAMQPRQVVTLGMQRGVAHFALCQAVSRLGLDARCHAVQPKAGQGENPTLDAALEYNERVYGAFADVVDCAPVKAASQFDDGSVDLLLLNAETDEVELDYLFERWRPKLSSRSVVLIPSVARRDPGYEAFRDFDALMTRYPGFAFQHGGGLGLVMVGEQPSGMLESLLGSEESPTAQQVVRDVFARLGRTCLDSFNAREQKARADELKASLEEQQRQLGELTEAYEQRHEALQARDRELGDVKQCLDRQVEYHAHERGQLAERVSLLQEFRDDMKSELTALRARLEEQQRRQAESAQQASKLLDENHANVARIQRFEQELTERRGEVERLSGELGEASQTLGERKQRLAALRQQLEESEAERAKAETRGVELEERLDERDQEREAQEARIQELENDLAKRQAAEEEGARQRDQLESRLAERDQARDAQEARIRELEQDNERLNREASEFSSRDEASQEHCRDLETRLQEKVSALAAKQQEVDSRFEELAKLTKMLEENEQTRERLEQESRQAEQKRETQQARIQELERDNERLSREASDASSREDALQQKREDLEQRLQEQTSALEGKQQEVDERFEELGKLTKMLNETKQERDELRRINEAQSASIDERFQELATLTRMLEENEQAQSGESEAQAEVERQAKEIQQLIASLEAYRRPRVDVDPRDYRLELYTKKRRSRKEKAQIERHRQVIASSPLFDAEWYLAQYPDVANDPKLARDPARHYLLFGGYEGRNPGPGFDSNFYQTNNPDVLYRGMNPLLHYMECGEAEQRQVLPQ